MLEVKIAPSEDTSEIDPETLFANAQVSLKSMAFQSINRQTIASGGSRAESYVLDEAMTPYDDSLKVRRSTDPTPRQDEEPDATIANRAGRNGGRGNATEYQQMLAADFKINRGQWMQM